MAFLRAYGSFNTHLIIVMVEILELNKRLSFVKKKN